MNDDLKQIVDKIFPARDVKIIEKMVEVVDRNLSDSDKKKRMDELEGIIIEVVESD